MNRGQTTSVIGMYIYLTHEEYITIVDGYNQSRPKWMGNFFFLFLILYNKLNE